MGPCGLGRTLLFLYKDTFTRLLADNTAGAAVAAALTGRRTCRSLQPTTEDTFPF